MRLLQQKYRGVLAAIALCMSALLLQSLGAAFVHVTLVEHTFCEDHQAVEHADAGDEANHDGDHADHGEASHNHADEKPGDQLPGEHDGDDESCDWLTWLQGPSVSVSPIHASLIDLPPPAGETTRIPDEARADIPTQIDLLRLSPGHSPPA